MPFTFSAGSFSFLKSSTTSQSNIKQNNNVDNVNNNNNNIVNDNNLDMGKNHHSPLNNTTVNVIPMVRRVRSLDNSTPPPKSNRRTSNASNLKNTNNRRVWLKSFFGRIHQTFSRFNDDDNNNTNDHDCDVNNTVVNNNNVGSGVEVVAETGSISDDDLKSKNVETGKENYSFICHGNTHDFFVVTKNGSTPKCSIPKWSMSNGTSLSNGNMLNGSLSSGFMSNGSNDRPMSNGRPISNGSLSSGFMSNGSNDRPMSNGRPISNGSLLNDSLKPSSFISSSVFEECAKTPRHFAKEPEVLGKVGRFTIVREREDFDTTYFDQCHCQQKPCRFSSSGCSGTHPVLPPDNDNDHPPVRNLIQQQVTPISHYSCSNKNDSWSSSKSNRSFYSNNIPSSNSSRNSLPSLQQKYNFNGSCPTPIPVSKVTPHNVSSSNSSISRVILPQSSSSPNLVHLNQRSKIENKNISKNINSHNIIVVGNSGKYPNPPTNNNGSYHPQCNNYSTTVIKKSKKPSLANMKSTEEQQRRLSMPPTPTPSNYQPLNSHSSSNPTTPTNPSKFSLSYYHHPNEPHTTINCPSGRKFEVEWNTTSKSSSSSSTSSTSSSDTAYSPPSTISSVFSMASSPDKKPTISNNSTLSRRCSTLSSKCGRKFEVTILSSSSSPSNNCILNTSPHSTIGSVNSIIVDAANTDSIKY